MGCSSSASRCANQGDRHAATDFFQKYGLGKKLGHGHFGQVRVIVEGKEPAKVIESFDKAVKILDLREIHNSSDKRRLLYAHNEVSVLKCMGSHKNCIQLFDAFFCYDFCFIVMERCSKSMFQHLSEIPDLNERSIGRIFVQMLSAISHVHRSQALHRDIKVENFLAGGKDGATIKLCDFGLSVFLPPGSKRRGLCGTSPFMCPEMIKDQWYDTKADVWSFGVVVYTLLFGDFPYATKDKDSLAVRKAIAKGIAPKFKPADEKITPPSDCVVAFAKALLERDPDERPSAKHALSMPYMSMSENHCYMRGVELPSLRPALSLARRVGACGSRDLSDITPMDSWLNKLQLERRGDALPELKALQMELHADAPYEHEPNSDLYIPDFVVSRSDGFQNALSDKSTSCDSSVMDRSTLSATMTRSVTRDSVASTVAATLAMQKFSL